MMVVKLFVIVFVMVENSFVSDGGDGFSFIFGGQLQINWSLCGV